MRLCLREYDITFNLGDSWIIYVHGIHMFEMKRDFKMYKPRHDINNTLSAEPLMNKIHQQLIHWHMILWKKSDLAQRILQSGINSFWVYVGNE